MINKKELAKKLSQRTTLTQKEAGTIIADLFEIIFEEVKKEEEVSIVGFGKFYPYTHQPRPVRNPKTQEEMVLEEYKSLRFKPSTIVKKILKNKSEKK